MDEMGKILDHYMTLVPFIPAEQEVIRPNGSTIGVDTTQYHSVVLDGDQLTVARMRGTQSPVRYRGESSTTTGGNCASNRGLAC